jgi:hypothetical protein
MRGGLREEEKEKDEALSEEDKGRHGFVGCGGRVRRRDGLVEALAFLHGFAVLLECFSVTVHGSSSCNT